jgi:hypothetical protein
VINLAVGQLLVSIFCSPQVPPSGQRGEKYLRNPIPCINVLKTLKLKRSFFQGAPNASSRFLAPSLGTIQLRHAVTLHYLSFQAQTYLLGLFWLGFGRRFDPNIGSLFGDRQPARE